MNEHRFILEPYQGQNSRYHCPGCHQREKTFSLYVDTETGAYINPVVGRCNREINCGYHYTPRQFFMDNPTAASQIPKYKGLSLQNAGKNLKQQPWQQSWQRNQQQRHISYIPDAIFKGSLKNYDTNYLTNFLQNSFGADITSNLIKKYLIGTSEYWNGASVFWQIDLNGHIRTGKIMLYCPETGKRVKKPTNHISWAHTQIQQRDFNLKQCLFGEHLLKDTTKPVAVVESEKTAVIASVYLPQFIWLAVGGKNNIKEENLKVLSGRKIIFFPDLNCFENWSLKAKELSFLANFSVSDLLERKATPEEKEQGFDLADYLIKLNHKDFNKPEPIPVPDEPSPISPPVVEIKTDAKIDKVYFGYKEDPAKHEQIWNVEELESYFSDVILPSGPVQLNPWTRIENVPLFVENTLATIKINNGKRAFRPYMDRLLEFKDIINTIN